MIAEQEITAEKISQVVKSFEGLKEVPECPFVIKQGITMGDFNKAIETTLREFQYNPTQLKLEQLREYHHAVTKAREFGLPMIPRTYITAI